MAMEWYKGSKKKPSHEKKNIRYLNACLDAGLHDELDEFCKKNGMSKVGAVEAALRAYMNIGDGDDGVYWHYPTGSDIKREKKIFHISEETDGELTDYAKSYSVSKSFLMEYALKEFFKNHDKNEPLHVQMDYILSPKKE